jgi:hypothetical protein
MNEVAMMMSLESSHDFSERGQYGAQALAFRQAWLTSAIGRNHHFFLYTTFSTWSHCSQNFEAPAALWKCSRLYFAACPPVIALHWKTHAVVDQQHRRKEASRMP